MKKVIKFIKSNILGFLVGLSLCLNGVIIAENMLSSEQVSYSGSKTEQTTVKGTLDELFSAVDINERLGSTDISSVGNGTVTGAISNINNTVSELSNIVSNITEVIPFRFNIAYANSIDGIGSSVFPCTGVAIKNKITKKIDIHFDFLIETHSSEDRISEEYRILNKNRLIEALSINTLHISDPSSQTRVVLDGGSSATLNGKSGLKIATYSTSNAFYIGRAYLSDLTELGWWATNTQLFNEGNLFHVDIYGANYT